VFCLSDESLDRLVPHALGSVCPTGAVGAATGEGDVAGIELKATRSSYPIGGVTKDVRREVDDATALHALRVQVSDVMVRGIAVTRRRVDQVVRRQAAVEVDVNQYARRGESVQGPIDRRAVHARAARRDLAEDLLGGQMLAARLEHRGEDCHPRLGDSLTGRAQQ
jgi:hypothetical protein